jgi:hypothetical protein
LPESWLLCTVVHKSAHKLASTKAIVGTYSLHLLPMERLELLLAFNISHKMTIHTNCMINDTDGGIVFKTLQYILIKLQHVN